MRMSDGYCMCTTKYFLCVFNYIFFVIGTIVLGIGLWILLDTSSLIALLKLVENNYIDKFANSLLIEQMAIALIIIGGATFFLSFLGYCGTIRESRCILITYIVLMVLLFIAKVVIISLATLYKDKIHMETRAFLQSSITDYYGDGEASSPTTEMWNGIMSTYECCGVNDYQDFEMFPDWKKNKGNITVPEACCVLEDVAKLVPRDSECVESPSDSNSYWNNGCYQILTNWITLNREIIVVILIIIGIVDLVAISSSICIAKGFTKLDDIVRL